MEPDIIRMYSSSPPPLDNGAEEEDEDEFGDFGGFSDAGSTGAFDFASDYSSSKEEHKPSCNSDYSGSVDGIIAFTTVKEFPLDSNKEKCECRSLGTSLDDIYAEEVRTGKLESSYSEIIWTDMKVSSQDHQVDSCNGEKQPCPEVLTNGFAALDTANSQEAEDTDGISDSKGLKIISTNSSELSLESIPTTAEDFADFATFSNKQTSLVDETGNKICTNSNEREVLCVQESNIINGEGESMKKATSDRSCEYGQICISKINLAINEDFRAKEDCTSLEHNAFISSIHATVNSVGTTESIGGREECDTGNSKEHTFLRTNDNADTLSLNVGGVQSLGSHPTEENVYVSEIVKNGESDIGHASCSGLNEDDFGDFGTVSNGSLAFTQVSASQEHFQSPSEETSKRSNACGDFTDRSDVHQQSSKGAPQSKEISNEEECCTDDAGSSMTVQPLAELENGNDSEFGDFGLGVKRFPDSDEFSAFSSAGCNQATEWNAFEAEQKESCLWAAFEDEQVVEPHARKDVWPSDRTDTTFDDEDSVTHTPNSVSVASLHGTGSGKLQDLPASARTKLLSRLERIFEACFPPVTVSEMEEEIAPLNLLLEMSNKPGRTEEALSQRELLDVWTELQDIHDAYGLKYQWGGSLSNKKLLCSLGIDTRNILFTGNKKQPVIVPMYAAGLGMLEPTKEPLKPISAAEKIASIGQTPLASPEMNICTTDQFQESLPPVQFDWSSSGLTNPLDASGGSTLLNLDFFGPVDDSSSSTTTTIPGVDPELYELTTSKLETSNSTSKVTDAFAKLMSTVEKASTSARKPKKEEQLSEEAAKVISSLPDLSFMHAKVLMFPATLTPSTSCQGKVD
ncbi:aftiphilin isoform X1 [Lacerta agilis]|uniref:aftiphilin isoform X1 n=1 Tax=Lacerta agilis TaxID=80427 RepID=UPI00141A5C35|nr:aftiphilin isoform X1 [Lacerta agilis]XP_032998627.1 aftiphilin isoform X1 [Lacerta agilis]XP_032998629.1 aftiphilin isoform X1 [Lacerta agilis]